MPPRKFVWVASIVAAVGFAAVAKARAQDSQRDSQRGGVPEKAEKMSKDEVLRRYDKNANGKLDPDEEAAMRADQERAKERRRKR